MKVRKSIKVNYFCAVLLGVLLGLFPGMGSLSRAEEPPRKDLFLGSAHEGLVMDSGAGRDTILQVTPPPDQARDDANSEPLVVNGTIETEVIVPVRPGRKP